MNPNLAEVGKATRFKPGNRVGSQGRPKKTPITDEIRKLLPSPACGGKVSNAHMIAQSLIERAQTGDVQAARVVLEYIEGKPVQPIDIRRALEDEAERMATELGMDVALAMREVEAVMSETRRR